MKRRFRTMLFGILILIGALAVAGFAYPRLPKFGALPGGSRLEAIEKSPNYANGQFQNREPVPPSTNDEGMLKASLKYLLTKKDRPAPPAPIPSVKTDLKALDPAEDLVVWLGHSSFYIQISGKRLLLDPVFSENAAPVPFANRAFAGSNIYTAEDMPQIDCLLITHDHWDHLDYPTVMALRDKIRTVVCPLGIGAHFERWGFAPESIREGDWDDAIPLGDGLTVHVLTARHYTGRWLTQNKALWAAYALISPGRAVYISGDSGYGSHYAEAGKTFGGFDLAILDCAQYNEGWRYIHMNPEDAAMAADDLRAKAVIPAHAGKFSIAYHSWDDPFLRFAAASRDQAYRLLTPRLGEAARPDDAEQAFTRWWEPLSVVDSAK